MSAAKRVALLKALADETRLKIAAALLEKPTCAEELAERLKRASSTISFHLRKLEEAGLVTKAKAQYYLVYALRRELLDATLAELVGAKRALDGAEEKSQKRYRDKVLRAFFEDGRLVQMPKQWRKRRVVLDEILPAFEAGRDYDEREVDARIHAFADDHCTVRRMLVDEKLMWRRGRTYRRVTEEEVAPMSARDEEKQLKREYKEAPREAGIFRIANTANGKVYLGSSLNLHGPINKHRFALKMSSHINKALQADFARFGEGAFVFEIVETVKRADDPSFNAEDELSLLEEIWIEKEKPFSERGYNDRKKIRE
jgi:DNA-binding HxlR family transcriptional regulator